MGVQELHLAYTSHTRAVSDPSLSFTVPGVKASNYENSRGFVDSSTSLVRAEEVEAAVGVFPGRGVVAVEAGARQRPPGAVQRGGQVHVAAFFAIFVEELTTCSVKYC